MLEQVFYALDKVQPTGNFSRLKIIRNISCMKVNKEMAGQMLLILAKSMKKDYATTMINSQ